MRRDYNKLVRDGIPGIIEAHGGRRATEVPSAEQYRDALRTKLVEEAGEVLTASPDGLLAELADVAEVLDALLGANGLTRDALEAEQARRRAARGGFGERLRLLWAE